MERTTIKSFGLEYEAALTVLVEASLYSYDLLKCPKCHLVHNITAEQLIEVAKACPEGEEERNFLFFMFGALAQHGSYWTLMSLLIRACNYSYSGLDVTRQFLRELIHNQVFRDPEDDSSSC